ncbi:MAG: hypothetical protein ABJN03_19610 [Ascidiaceihabitans sp.]|uniref:hypothetical protein n=1 Tax=Rhodobacterales TaxID=204455 RepID=UPI00329A1BE1
MARTPKPPKLTHGGLNALQKLVIGLFIGGVGIMFFLPLAIVKVLNIPNLRMGADDVANLWAVTKLCVVLFVLVSPFFWRLTARFLAWGFDDLRPSRWKYSPLAKMARDYKNRDNLSSGDHMMLHMNIQDVLHFLALPLIMITTLYFTFWPWHGVVGGWETSNWIRTPSLFAPYVVGFFVLLHDKFNWWFYDLAYAVMGGEYDYSKEDAGEAQPNSALIGKGNTASENREKMAAALFVGAPLPKEEDFSFDLTAFSQDSKPKKKFTPEEQREAAEIDWVLFGDPSLSA